MGGNFSTFSGCLRRVASACPDRTAMQVMRESFEMDSSKIDYRKLDWLVENTASQLSSSGVSKGEGVIVPLFDNDDDSMLLLLGVLAVLRVQGVAVLLLQKQFNSENGNANAERCNATWVLNCPESDSVSQPLTLKRIMSPDQEAGEKKIYITQYSNCPLGDNVPQDTALRVLLKAADGSGIVHEKTQEKLAFLLQEATVSVGEYSDDLLKHLRRCRHFSCFFKLLSESVNDELARKTLFDQKIPELALMLAFNLLIALIVNFLKQPPRAGEEAIIFALFAFTFSLTGSVLQLRLHLHGKELGAAGIVMLFAAIFTFVVPFLDLARGIIVFVSLAFALIVIISVIFARRMPWSLL